MTNDKKDEVFEQVDEISHTVLTCIQNGDDDVQKITSATTLPNHKINYRFTKLEDLDLIQVSKSRGTVERTINGQNRVFQTPKQAQLTDKAREYLDQADTKTSTRCDDLTREELVQKTRQLEQRVEHLEQKLELFQEQIQRQLQQ
jgi:predicted transcriptional regulator